MESNNPNVRESQEVFIKNISKPLDAKGLQMSVSIDFQDTKLGFKNAAKPNYRKEYKICRATKHSVVFKSIPLKSIGRYSCNFYLPDVLIPMKESAKPFEPPKMGGPPLDKKPKDKKFKYYRKDEYSGESSDMSKEVTKKKTAVRYDYLK